MAETNPCAVSVDENNPDHERKPQDIEPIRRVFFHFKHTHKRYSHMPKHLNKTY